MRVRFGLVAAVAAACMVPTDAGTQVLMQRDISLSMALTIVLPAREECGPVASIAIIDRAGRIKVMLRGDGGSPHHPELARRKAFAALSFRSPSAASA